jgi:NTE family protein
MEWVGPELSPILKALMEDLDGSLYCICFDRGFFLGRTIREFFERVLDAYLKRIGKETLQREKINHDGGFLTFSELKRLSKIDLVITGTNITLSEPLCFSEKITPNFPVAEAVAISMNLPILFKPIVVKSQVPVTEEDEFLKGISPDGFKGEWVDGGLLNNLPLHVFDHIGFEDPTKPVPLNPNIVAFRLFGGYDPNRAGRFLNTPWGKIDLDAKPDKPLGIFFGFLASLFDTLLSPSGKGQLRNWREKDQTVQFFTDRLSTLEFSPSRSKRDDPIRAARKATIDYFKSERKK